MTRPEISITVARRCDAFQIALMSRDLVEMGLRWSWTPDRVTRSIGSRETIVAVARHGNRLAGFGIMRYDRDEAHLDLFALAHDYRRQGLGRRLLEWLEKPAIIAGISDVLLEVRGSNRGAQAFYERLGFRKLEMLPRYYQGREPALRMSRKLGFSGRQLAFDSRTFLSELLRPTRLPEP